MTTIKPTRTCVWCDPPHIIEQGDEGAGTTHGMCPTAEAREWAKMPMTDDGDVQASVDATRVQDIAVLLIGGAKPWQAAANCNRITALQIAEDALRRAREIGVGRA